AHSVYKAEQHANVTLHIQLFQRTQVQKVPFTQE
ncbi:hypothetical protein AE98_05561, partial [Klebsiella pneumoniae CHS 42]